MSKNRINQGHSVDAFSKKFGFAIDSFSKMLKETSIVNHGGNKGEEREVDVAEFFGHLLPMTYRCVAGEAVDLYGTVSPSLDVMVYDRDKNFPFYSGKREVIPAEALLTSVEVKSVLNSQHINSAFSAANKLKELKPGKVILNEKNEKKEKYRYFHCVFAMSTDISSDNWAAKEFERAISNKKSAPGQEYAIDLIYVLHRGLINLNRSTWMPENSENGQALLCLFYSIYNFIERENRRRSPAPFFSYADNINSEWKKL